MSSLHLLPPQTHTNTLSLLPPRQINLEISGCVGQIEGPGSGYHLCLMHFLERE